jgi:hypothetical protein
MADLLDDDFILSDSKENPVVACADSVMSSELAAHRPRAAHGRLFLQTLEYLVHPIFDSRGQLQELFSGVRIKRYMNHDTIMTQDYSCDYSNSIRATA